MRRRTTGELLEVHRCALGLGASLPAIWRSTCGRARIKGLAESSSSWALANCRDRDGHLSARAVKHGSDEFPGPPRAPGRRRGIGTARLKLGGQVEVYVLFL